MGKKEVSIDEVPNLSIPELFELYADIYATIVPHVKPHQELIDKAVQYMSDHVNPKDRVLDQGTAVGILPRKMAALGYEAYGIDLQDAMLEHARIISKEEGYSINFSKQDATQLQFDDAYFGGVSCINVNYAIPNQARGAFSEAHRVLKKDGIYTVTGLKPDCNMDEMLNITLQSLQEQGLVEKFAHQLHLGQVINMRLAQEAPTRLDKEGLVDALYTAGFREIIYSDNNSHTGISSFAVARK